MEYICALEQNRGSITMQITLTMLDPKMQNSF
jgi:hypothetical protein